MKKKVFLFALLVSLMTGCAETVQPVVSRPQNVKPKTQNAAVDEIESRIPLENINLEVYKDSFIPELADAAELSELVIRQYEAIHDGDKQAYLDTLNLSGLVYQEDYFKVVSEDDPSERIMRGYMYRLPYILLGFRGNSDFDLKDKDKAEKSYEMLCEAVDNLSTENADLILDSEHSAFVRLADEKDTSAAQVGKNKKHIIDETAFVDFLINAGSKKDKTPFLKTKITFYCGDHSHVFDAYVWKNGTERGCYIYNTEIDDNIFYGMSPDEIREAKNVQKALNDEISQANIRTVAANKAVILYLEKNKTDFKTALENGDFAMASSPKGLDLSGGKPEAEGDKALYNANYKAYGVSKNGMIYIGERFDAEDEYSYDEVEEYMTEESTETSEDATEETTGKDSAKSKNEEEELLQNWFIQWRLDDSSNIIGQYPDVYDSKTNQNITWTEYFKPSLLVVTDEEETEEETAAAKADSESETTTE